MKNSTFLHNFVSVTSGDKPTFLFPPFERNNQPKIPAFKRGISNIHYFDPPLVKPLLQPLLQSRQYQTP